MSVKWEGVDLTEKCGMIETRPIPVPSTLGLMRRAIQKIDF
ncbi:MAG: hypothetical protein AABY50_09265 [Nitrospirota bacterium]